MNNDFGSSPEEFYRRGGKLAPGEQLTQEQIDAWNLAKQLESYDLWRDRRLVEILGKMPHE